MRIYGNADSAKIECDEDGFHLVIETDEGDRINVRVHGVADELLESVTKSIGAWVWERENARATRPAPIDLDGYDRGDPKRVSLERQLDGGNIG